MNERIKRLQDRLPLDVYPICTERLLLTTESCQQTEEQPRVLRSARAFAHYLDNRTIFIEDDELLVGHAASRPNGLEASCPTWPHEEIVDLRNHGMVISDEDEAVLKKYDDYWKVRIAGLTSRRGTLYDDDRLWPFIQAGILLPPWVKKDEGRGYGIAGWGWAAWGWDALGTGSGRGLDVLDYASVINRGFKSILDEANEDLKNLRYTTAEALEKGYFLQGVIISVNAMIRIAHRYADLAEKMAKDEIKPERKKELLRMSETCRWVPENKPRTFYEAMQFFWFLWVTVAAGTTSGGRFDQYMYPYYLKDKASGVLSDEETLELLEMLRIKVMQVNGIAGGKMQREKWAGMARWNNWVIGGVTPEGKDATNELSYLILQAAMNVQTPHHTVTVRVHDGTPDDLLIKALEVVKTGIGMPAFVGDKSYIGYFTREGVPLDEARNYALGGCLEANLPGKSGSTMAYGMFLVPLVFDITMHDGIEPRTGKQLGPKTGKFEDFKTYEDFLAAFKAQLKHFMSLEVEEHNMLLKYLSDVQAAPFVSILYDNAIKAGRDCCNRKLLFENSSCLNVVGMINAADSLAAIKKLVFDDKKITMKQLKTAMDANWSGDGFEEMHNMFLKAPKFGNGDQYVDSIASDLYKFWAETTNSFTHIWGSTVKPSGVSITAHGPGGSLVGATPDGRYAGQNLADGTLSAAQGMDTKGPTALMRSAMSVDQVPFQSTLLNMKFHPSAMKTMEDLKKLASLIKTYFSMNGKHVQFNVVSRETLKEAQAHPEEHRDLIVRVAGYSAYFVQLTKAIQEDIISRTEHSLK